MKLKFKPTSLQLAITLIFALLLSSCVDETDNAAATAGTATTNQLIVNIKPNPLQQRYALMSAELQQQLSQDAGVKLEALRVNGDGAQIMRLPQEMPQHAVEQIAKRIATRGDVLWAEADARYQATLVPNDPAFPEHWNLREGETVPGGAALPDAWDITTGSPNLVVAVVDTGVLPHNELAGRLLDGYDFISNANNAGDGNGRDANATDEGDWITATEATQLGLTAGRASSWHGTHVAGIIGAAGNNGMQVTGVNWQSKILPIRVLGKGGGYLSDIADAIRWAAGGTVPGVPQNTNPARVINLSLGGQSPTCPYSYQTAINYALSQKSVVVAAAGNEDNDAAQNSPANCAGVISVASVAASGAKAYYSSWGSSVTIAAPGGDLKYERAILSLGDRGETTPLFDNSLMELQGTSMATPHVAGIVSLMLSVNPALTPEQIINILQATARQFPGNTRNNCTTRLCGAGIINAAAAVKAAATGTSGATSAVPQSGWWWNPQEGGRGFALEIRDGKLFFGGFLYNSSGKSTWYVSGPNAMQDAKTYLAPLSSFSNGQTLTGDYRAPVAGTDAGTLQLQFRDATHGTLTWSGGSIPIERFEIAAGGLTTTSTSFAPETGWWWNTDQGGRGFAIEVQSGTLFMAGFMYDDAGDPVWYLSSGAMTSSKSYSGSWAQYSNGQSINGTYRSPQLANGNVGSVKLDFKDTAHATLILPNGKQVDLERFHIGFQSPAVTTSSNKEKTTKLIGIWGFDYTILSKWTDYYLFDTLRESSSEPDTFYVLGIDEYDDPVIGSYDPELGQYLVLDQGYTIDQVFIFDLLGDTAVSGCYYQINLSDESWSECYPMTGSKLFDVTPTSANWMPKRATTDKRGKESELRAELTRQHRQAAKRSTALAAPATDTGLRGKISAMRQQAAISRMKAN